MIHNKIKQFSTLDLTGKILISTMDQSYLLQSVIFIFKHDENGAVGVIINKPLPYNGNIEHSINQNHKNMTINQSVLPILNFENQNNNHNNHFKVHFGGLSCSDTYYILHTQNVIYNDTIFAGGLGITKTKDVENVIYAMDNKNDQHICCMGCIYWKRSYLEEELLSNYWMYLDFNKNFIFNVPDTKKWDVGYKKLSSVGSIFININGNA